VPVAVEQIFEGMPDPAHLRRIDTDDRVMIMVGDRLVFEYQAADAGMRNIAVVTLTQLKFAGKDVAAVMGLTPVYVSMLRARARDEGSAGLVRDRGRPTKLTAAQVVQACSWRDEGLSDVLIGQRLGVADTTVARALRDHPAPAAPQATLDLESEPEPDAEPDAEPEADAGTMPGVEGDLISESLGENRSTADPGCRGSAWIGDGVLFSRYAGAMLVHAFSDRLDTGAILSGAVASTPAGPGSSAEPGGRLRFDDIALLTATSMAFGLGAATIEQVKHLSAREAGPLCGLEHLPDLRTLRPRLAALADRIDPLLLQRTFAAAMLEAEACTSGVYFVDDHFVPYTGAKPVPKGWDTKHRLAQRGRADTWIIDTRGRALIFTTGEPSGLTKTLPPALKQLRAVIGKDAKIMLGFDRGGAYASVFTACAQENADWITYRRAPLAPVLGLPRTTIITDTTGTPQTLTYTDEPVTINEYGTARQISLLEHGTVVLQILTSDNTACPIGLLITLRARWRIENVFKYAAEHYGIDALGDYIAEIETNTRLIDNPARKTANAAVKTLKTELGEAEQSLAQLLADRTLTVTTLNRKLTTTQNTITRTKKTLAAAQETRDTIPAKLPANQIDPGAQRALLRTTRRSLHMVLRLLAYNSEHWLSEHLNAYLHDPNEYRAITRQTILRGLTGTITYTPTSITVDLNPPDNQKISRALTLLLNEINTTPPHLPGDARPITYTLTPRST
jgi:hypothetical protein